MSARKEPPYSGAMLDTSVWVAVFEGEDVADGLEAAQGDLETLTSPIVLAELASLHARARMEGATPMDAVLQTARLEPLTAEDALAGGAVHGRLRREGHAKVGLGDCLVHATARRLGALLVTCDADLAGEEGVVVLGRPKARAKAARARAPGR